MSYRYVPEPVPVVEMLPPKEPEVAMLEPLDEEPAFVDTINLAEGPPELEYVATLKEADADVEEGFASSGNQAR